MGSWRPGVAAAAALAVVLLAHLALVPRSDADGTGDAGAPGARALYEAGLNALHEEADRPSALRLFTAALRRDSTFALAAYYAGVTSGAVTGQRESVRLLDRAEALSAGAPDRERLFILAGSALQLNDPSAGTFATRLARSYPGDPAGAMMLGSSLAQAGEFPAAVRQFRHALALMPATDPPASAGCTRCDAYARLADVYWMADSLDAAIAVTGEWAAFRPGEAAPRSRQAAYLLLAGRPAEATVARLRAAELGDVEAADVLFDAVRAIRSADFAAADPGLEYLGRAAAADVARGAVWLQVISFRNQRRFTDAMAAATRYREMLQPGQPAQHPYATPQAVVLLESGRPQVAAALFDTMFHQLPELGRASRTARDRAWLLTLRAAALAVAGDTAHLADLADRIEGLGRESGYGRDRRLHHHVRGLLFRARGDLPAAEREFGRATYSATAGYTRTNVELAATLLEAGRAAEAIPHLRAALRAPLDGPAYYVTRTELYELLAGAFARAAMPDSAAAWADQAARSGAARPRAEPSHRRRLIASHR